MRSLTVMKLNECGDVLWRSNKCLKTISNNILVGKFNGDTGNIIYAKQLATNLVSNKINSDVINDVDNNMYIGYVLNNVSNYVTVKKLTNMGTEIWTLSDAIVIPINAIITVKLCMLSSNLYCVSCPQENSGKYDIKFINFDDNGNNLLSYNIATNVNVTDVLNYDIDNDVLGNIYSAIQLIGLKIRIMKTDATGVVIWTNDDINTTNMNITPSIDVDRYGNSYISYSTNGTIENQYNAYNSGGYDIVLIKLNTLGEVIWKAQHPSFNTIENDLYPSITVDGNQNIYLTYTSVDGYGKENVVIVRYTTTNCFDKCGGCNKKCCKICLPKCDIATYSLKKNKLKCIKKCCKDAACIEKINKGILEYKKELDTIADSIEIIKLMAKNYNDLSHDVDSNKYIWSEIKNQAKMYHKKNINESVLLYGTIYGGTGMPMTYANGFGGITNNTISGDMAVRIDTKTYYISMLESMTVHSLATKIRSKICNELAVVDGLEISIKINCCPAHIKMTLYDCNRAIEFSDCVQSNCKHSYKHLLQNINNTYANYIRYSDYNCVNDCIYIVFKKGYTLSFSQGTECPYPQFTVSTYVNYIPVNYGTTSSTHEKYAYGYMLFYNIKNNFTITYPPNALPNAIVKPLLVKETYEYYCVNMTLNISDIIKCDLRIINTYKLCCGSETTVHIKYGMKYGFLLLKIVGCVTGEYAMVNRLYNFSEILKKYSDMLTALHKLINLSAENFTTASLLYIK